MSLVIIRNINPEISTIDSGGYSCINYRSNFRLYIFKSILSFDLQMNNHRQWSGTLHFLLGNIVQYQIHREDLLYVYDVVQCYPIDSVSMLYVYTIQKVGRFRHRYRVKDSSLCIWGYDLSTIYVNTTVYSRGDFI